MTTWLSSSAAQPIQGWQQGSHFTSSPYSSGFLHGGMQRPRQSPYYYDSFCSSLKQPTQAHDTLQFQDELNELMMGNDGECEPQSPSGTDEAQHPLQWSGEAQCGTGFSPSFDPSLIGNDSEYAMSSFDSATTSPQEPTSPVACQWEAHHSVTHIRRDSVNNLAANCKDGTYNQYGIYNMFLQHSDIMQGSEDQMMNHVQPPDASCCCQLSTSSNTTSGDFKPALPVFTADVGSHGSFGDVSPPLNADTLFHKNRWLPEGAKIQQNLREEQDRLIIEGKRRNMSYKEIKEHYKIEGAVSTLRGRYRAAVKPKSQRVRKPEWKPKDLELLAHFVNQRLGQGKVRRLKNLQPIDYLYIPWKSVVQDIADNGGSYHFGPSAAKKRFLELVAADKAREEAVEKGHGQASAPNAMSMNNPSESFSTERELTQHLILPYELHAHRTQQPTSQDDLQTSLHISPYALAYAHSNPRSTSHASLPAVSYHRLPIMDPSLDTLYSVVPNSIP